MIKQNLHTHSCYDDGKDPIDDIVKEAIARKFTVLGFSGHGSNWPIDGTAMNEEQTAGYIRDVQAARDKYRDQIDIYCGIEQDSLKRLDCEPYDYVIGSVHFMQKGLEIIPVDQSPQRFKEIRDHFYDGDMEAFARDYYRFVQEQAYWPEVDIIGHLDLISKYNENEEFFPFEAQWYLKYAHKAIDIIIEQGKIIEMNTGAISRKTRLTPYPHQSLLEYIAQKGGKVCINTDCHNKDWLDTEMTECLDRAKKAGLKELWKKTPDGFVPYPIEEFYA